MATATTHLILSGVELEGEEVAHHSLFEDVQFDEVQDWEESPDRHPGVKMIYKSPLKEEEIDFSRLAREASEAFPEATVFMMNVEERFEQVERVQSLLYVGGKNAGEVEQGYVFNIGGG